MNQLENIISGTPATNTPLHPKIRCVDGFTISVQTSWANYCLDSTGNRPGAEASTDGLNTTAVPPFIAVECGFPSQRPEPWDEWEEYVDDSSDDPTRTVYGFVPVRMVRALVALHGGETQ